MKILFICSSNICRSPYCEYMFKKMIKEDERLSKIVDDVKSSAVLSQAKWINSKTVKALVREGLDEEEVKNHKPTFKWTSRQRFDDADIIIGMKKINKLFLPIRYWDKFSTLSEVATGEYKPIEDPYLINNIDSYYEAMDEIKEYLEKYAKNLITYN